MSENLHVYIVLILVCFVVAIQLTSFIRTRKRIDVFRSIFESIDGLKMVDVFIPGEDFANISPQEIIRNIDNYKDDAKPDNQKHFNKITLVDNIGRHPVLQQIMFGINTYLLRNKGAVSDFHLVKDIAERNCDSMDEEINNELPLPLYLGLMGTMFGIIVSVGFLVVSGRLNILFDISNSASGIDEVLTILLGGVGLAMISSLTGLAFTSWNTIFEYKGAKSLMESRKNIFFTFIQTELLPILSQNAASSLHRLESNLSRFNEKFSENNLSFNQTLSKIYESFEGHAQMVKELKEIDIKSITKFNAKVLKELGESTKQFEKFNIYIGLVNSLIENADKLNSKLNLQLDRTKTIEEVAVNLNENTLKNKKVVEFMEAHISEVKTRTALFNHSVTQLDEQMQLGIQELQLSFKDNVVKFREDMLSFMEENKNFTVEMMDEFKLHTAVNIDIVKEIQSKQRDAVYDNQGLFDKLNHLQGIEEGFSEQGEYMKSQHELLRSINENIGNAINGGKTGSNQPPKARIEKFVKYATWTFYTGGALIVLSVIFRQLFLLIKSLF